MFCHILEGFGNISGVNFWAALKLPLIFIAPLISQVSTKLVIHKYKKLNIYLNFGITGCSELIADLIQRRKGKKPNSCEELSRKKSREVQNSQKGHSYLIKAICGFIFPNATFTKSSSLNENVASGFPPSYGPIHPHIQIITPLITVLPKI